MKPRSRKITKYIPQKAFIKYKSGWKVLDPNHPTTPSLKSAREAIKNHMDYLHVCRIMVKCKYRVLKRVAHIIEETTII